MARKRTRGGLKLKWYIGGPISLFFDQAYRTQIRRALSERGHTWFDPYEEEVRELKGTDLAKLEEIRRGTPRDRGTSRTIIKRDFEAIRKCDALVAYLPIASVGSSVELAYASLLRMPTVVVAPGPISGWVHIADVVIHNIDELRKLLADEKRLRGLVERYR